MTSEQHILNVLADAGCTGGALSGQPVTVTVPESRGGQNLALHVQAIKALGIDPVGVEATHGAQAYLYEVNKVPMAERVHKPYDFARLATLAREGKRGALAYGDQLNWTFTRMFYQGEGETFTNAT